MDLQQAIEQTIRHHLDGTALEGIPDWRTVAFEIDDDRTGARLVCPDHGTLLAELDTALTVTAEYECAECEFQACQDCDQRRQRPCSRHAVLDDEAFEVAS